jgi:hypothetical protein
MKFESRGSVQGEKTHKYPRYRYLLVEPPRTIKSMHQLDPNRLDARKEYPRDTAMYPNFLETHSVIDYYVIQEPCDGQPWDDFKIYLMPNQYTDAKDKQLVYLSKCTWIGWEMKDYDIEINNALYQIFA